MKIQGRIHIAWWMMEQENRSVFFTIQGHRRGCQFSQLQNSSTSQTSIICTASATLFQPCALCHKPCCLLITLQLGAMLVWCMCKWSKRCNVSLKTGVKFGGAECTSKNSRLKTWKMIYNPTWPWQIYGDKIIPGTVINALLVYKIVYYQNSIWVWFGNIS